MRSKVPFRGNPVSPTKNMKLIKSEYTLIAIFAFILLGIALIVHSNILTFSCCFLAIIVAYLLAKGQPIGNAFGIILVILYSLIAFKARLYGEVILYLFVMLPLYLVSVFTWVKNYNKIKKTILVNEIKEFEWALICICQTLLFAIVYFTLKRLNTNELFFSTLSFTTLITTVYLGVRRNKYTFLFYFLNDIVLVILWGNIIFKNQWGLLPILISPAISCYYDLFGILKWNELRYYLTTIDQIEYRLLRNKNKEECLKLIKECINNLSPEVFIPYSEEELKNLFNPNYCDTYGAFDKNKLIGISQIYKNNQLIKDSKKILNLEKSKVAQIGGDLEYEEYNNKNIIKNLTKIQLRHIKKQDYEYVIALAHPKYKKYNTVLKELDFQCVKTETIEGSYLRNFYLIKL